MMMKPNSVTRAPWNYDVSPFKIADNVYYVGNKSVSVHLFDTGEGLLLLDTAYAETTYLLIESIRELGFDPHDIRWIIHSHAHIDHFGATRYLVEKSGIPEGYIENMHRLINTRFTISTDILNAGYYNFVFDKGEVKVGTDSWKGNG